MTFELAKDGSVTSNEFRFAAMDFLARREHSTRELKIKLNRKFGKRNYCAATLSCVIEKLTIDGILNDQRYSASIVRKLIGRGCGPTRIRAALLQQGVEYDEDTSLENALSEPVDWFLLAKAAYSKKYRGKAISGSWEEQRRERAKRLRFMRYRGFDSEICQRLVGAENSDQAYHND